ncbi:hypothetical protein [Kribbella ginsengisoli]|uniref:hypothetical protein n=1 Tax=Kribbella ginsengisoli TaxID=363865 RepID=UPI0031DDB58C
MSEQPTAEDLGGLLRRYLDGEVSVGELVAEFERLTFKLDGLTRAQEVALAGLVNELETIRFTLPEEGMPAAAGEVFSRAFAVVRGDSGG